MKKTALAILSLAIALTAGAQTLNRSVRPKPGPAPEIKLGKTESFTLPNGMRVFVVENHKLPTVTFNIQLDVKPQLEGNQAGYRQMMSDLLTSGTKSRSSEKLNEEIDYIGARLSAGDEGMYASCLKKHQTKLLELMADIAMNANLTQAELDKVKKRMLSGLEASENEPDDMLNNVSAVVNFSKSHPYGEVPTVATVNAVTLASVQNYYNTYYRPNVAYMAIVGDITMAEIKPLIEKYFGAWQKANVPVAQYPSVPPAKGSMVGFVPREGAVQSVINVTYPVVLEPGTPEVVKAKVVNSILGGGSNGRLFLNLREKHGWTYGSYSSISQDDIIGSFTAYAKCRNAVTDSSINEMLTEMKRLQTELVGAEELQNHIVNMSGAFAIGLENPQTVAQYAINIERYKMPADYYQNYLKNLAAVTAQDVQGMAKKYITPQNANIVVVGSKADVAKGLVKYASNNTITYYDNYGNVITPSETVTAPAGTTAETVMKKYIAAIGGEQVIMKIKDIKTVSKGTISMGPQSLEITITEMKKAPGSMKSLVEGGGMTLQKEVFNGSKGYSEGMGAPKTEMDANDIAEKLESADIQADLHPEKYGIKRTLRGMEKLDGNDVYVLDVVNGKGDKTVEYYDVKSGLLVRSAETQESPQGAVTIITDYSDYRAVEGGYKVPYVIKQSAGPQVITATVQSVEINKNIPDTEFN